MNERELIHSYDDKASLLLTDILHFFKGIEDDRARKAHAGVLIVSILNLICKTNEEKSRFLLSILLASGRILDGAKKHV